MAKLTVDGVEIVAYTPLTAPSRAIIALQKDLGMKMKDIVDKAQDPEDPAAETWAMKVLEFLSEHARGRFVTFDELLDRPVPQFTPDADEVARDAEARGAGEVPTSAGTDTPAPGIPADLGTGA